MLDSGHHQAQSTSSVFFVSLTERHHIQDSWIYGMGAEEVEDDLMKDDGQVCVGTLLAQRLMAGGLE